MPNENWQYLSELVEQYNLNRSTLTKAIKSGRLGTAARPARNTWQVDEASETFQAWLREHQQGRATMPYASEVARLNTLRTEVARLKVARDAKYGRDMKYDVPLFIKLLREGDELREVVAWVQEGRENPATNAPYDRYDIAAEFADVAYYMAGIYEEDHDPRDFVAAMQHYAAIAGMSVMEGLRAGIAKYEQRVAHPMLKTEDKAEALRQERAAILTALQRVEQEP